MPASRVVDIIMAGLLSARPAASSANEGYLYFATDTGGGTLYRSDGAAWSPVSAGRLAGAVTLSDAATIAVDASLGNLFAVTLGGNRTLGNPTGAVDGQRMVFRIRQDGTGSRTLSLDTKFRFGTDITSITLTTTAGKTDYLGVIYNSADDKFDVVSFVKGY